MNATLTKRLKNNTSGRELGLQSERLRFKSICELLGSANRWFGELVISLARLLERATT